MDNTQFLQATLDVEETTWLLGSISAFHRQPFSAELLLQHISPPLCLADLLEACQALGFSTG